MNSQTPKQRLYAAKGVFWQAVVANDVLNQLIIAELSKQSVVEDVARTCLPGNIDRPLDIIGHQLDIIVQPLWMGDELETLGLRISVLRSEPVIGEAYTHTLVRDLNIEVLSYSEDVHHERALVTAKDGSYAYVASEALWSLEVKPQEKADAAFLLFKAASDLKDTVVELGGSHHPQFGFSV